MTDAIRAEGLTLAYSGRTVLKDVTFAIPEGKLTALIGPNGCGKSTFLKSLVRAVIPASGLLKVAGKPLPTFSSRDLARRVGFLPQVLPIPEGITVRQLAGYGRSPHNNLWGRMRGVDTERVTKVLGDLDVLDLAETLVETLSGGQRQRVWLAMVLAQDTPIVLLDEPTTFLDINHQVGLLAVLRRIVAEGRTVVVVLHDLNQAFRHADHLVVMKDGRVQGCGTPETIAAPDFLHDVFGIDCAIHPDPEAGTPMAVIKA